MKLNEKIKALRSERGLTQKELAEAVGVSDKTISKWECARGGISLKEALKLSEALGAHIDDLLPVGAVADKEFFPHRIKMSPLSKILLTLTAALTAASLVWMAVLTAHAYEASMLTGWLHACFGVLIFASAVIVFAVRYHPDSVVASGFGKLKPLRIRSVYNLKRVYALAGETVSLAACVFEAAQFLGVAFIATGVTYAISASVRIAVLLSAFVGAATLYYVKFAKIRSDESIIRVALDSGVLSD